MVDIILYTHYTDNCDQDVITDKVGIGCHKTDIANIFVLNTGYSSQFRKKYWPIKGFRIQKLAFTMIKSCLNFDAQTLWHAPTRLTVEQ